MGDHGVHPIPPSLLSAGQTGRQKPVLLTRIAGAEWTIALTPWCTCFLLLSVISALLRLSSEQDHGPMVLKRTALKGAAQKGTAQKGTALKGTALKGTALRHTRASEAGARGQQPGRGAAHTRTHGHTGTQTRRHTDTRTSWCRDLEVAAQAAAES